MEKVVDAGWRIGIAETRGDFIVKGAEDDTSVSMPLEMI